MWKIKKGVADYDSDISFGTISTVFSIMNERNKDVLKFIKQLSAILLLSVIVIQASSQIANIIINANEYGIYYANGFNKNNIIGIMMIEAVFRFILATTLAIIVGVMNRYNVFENIELPLLAGKAKKSERKKIVEHNMELVGIKELNLYQFLLSCQNAIALAAATLRESTWWDIGMQTL